ncbi:hypothetical protein D3C85_1056340 [compost metagenome]
MVEFLEPSFCPLMRNGMVKRRGEKKQDHASAVQTVAGDRHRIRVGVYRLNQQQHQAHDAKNKANTVADTVGYFLGQ